MTKKRNPCLAAALEYLERGFSVIPVDRETKKPKVSWKIYQSQHPTEEEIHEWFASDPNANVAIVTGSISNNIYVVDCDGKQGIQWANENLPASSAEVISGRDDGLHKYFQAPEGKEVKTGTKLVDQVDIRGEGGYIIAPPSIHANGKIYEWQFTEGLGGLEDLEVVNPYDFLPLQANSTVSEQSARNDGNSGGIINLSGVSTLSEIAMPAMEGERNSRLAALSGYYLNKGLGFEDTLALCRIWNASNQPPLDEAEVARTVQSIYKAWQRSLPVTNSKIINLEPQSSVDSAVSPEVENNETEPEALVTEDDVGSVYPSEILQPGGILQEIMDYTDASSAASMPLFNLGIAIGIIGTVCGMKVETETGLKTNFLIFAVGYSGSGKNAGNKVAQKIFQSSDLNKLLGPTELASASGLLSYLAEKGQHNILCCIDETGMLIEGLKQKNSHLSDIPRVLTKLFSAAGLSETKSYARQKESIFIPWQHLSVYGSTTPETLWASLEESDTASGFLARILVFECLDESPLPKGNVETNPPKKLVKQLEEIAKIKTKPLKDLSKWGLTTSAEDMGATPIPHVIDKTDEAKEIFEEFNRKFHELQNKHRKDSTVSSIYGRVAEHAHKLALVHAVSKHGANIVKNKVDVDSVEWAIMVAEACANKTIERIQDSISANKWHAYEQKVIKHIKAKATKACPGISKRQITQHCHISSSEASNLINSMLESGIIFSKSYKGGTGPETTIYCLPKKGVKKEK